MGKELGDAAGGEALEMTYGIRIEKFVNGRVASLVPDLVEPAPGKCGVVGICHQAPVMELVTRCLDALA